MLTFDVEDWFQVENLRPLFPIDTWDAQPKRVAASTRVILDLLSEHRVRSTFFVLGRVAEWEPELVRAVVAGGHELACHGYGHVMPCTLAPDAFREDLRRAKGILEDLGGSPVVGYRAPSFSIDRPRLEVVFESGFRYDSSYHPFSLHDRYGRLSDLGHEVRPGFFRMHGDRWEVALPVVRSAGVAVPASGGGYFRLFPGFVFRRLVANALGSRGSYVSYLHSWEFDPEQPRVGGLGWITRFRHYNSLARTLPRMQALLEFLRERRVTFAPIREVLDEIEAATAGTRAATLPV